MAAKSLLRNHALPELAGFAGIRSLVEIDGAPSPGSGGSVPR